MRNHRFLNVFHVKHGGLAVLLYCFNQLSTIMINYIIIGTKMNKDETLKSLELAEIEINRLVEKAKLFQGNVKADDKFLPIELRESKLGEWFYSDGQKLKALSNNPLECMSNIEQLHEDLHKRYEEMYTIYFGEEESGGLLSKIFKPRQKVLTDSERKLIDEEYASMQKTATELSGEIARLVRRLVAVSEEKINSL